MLACKEGQDERGYKKLEKYKPVNVEKRNRRKGIQVGMRRAVSSP